MKAAIPIAVPVPEGGCTYREHPDYPACRKVCNPGEKMCPHHLLLTEHAKVKTEAKTPRGYTE